MIGIGLPIKDVALLRDCLKAAVKDDALIAEFHRLSGYDLRSNRAPIEQLIDEHTGRFEDAARAFYWFVVGAIYWPLQNAYDALERDRAKELADAQKKD
jgi:hypothetical protein